jgi:hypothetical protein
MPETVRLSFVKDSFSAGRPHNMTIFHQGVHMYFKEAQYVTQFVYSIVYFNDVIK